jgi:YVTN family beta-propeller protein
VPTEPRTRRPAPTWESRRGAARFGPWLAAVVVLLLLVPTLGSSAPARPAAFPTRDADRIAPPSPLARASTSLGSVLGTLDVATDQTFAGFDFLNPQFDPSTAVLDTANGLVYVRGSLGDTISVVDPTHGSDIADIAVPYAQQPYVVASSIAVDPFTDYLYVANSNTANVTIIDGTTNTVTGAISLGVSPYADVFDPANGDVYVADWTAGNLTVIDATTNRTDGGIRTGTDPGAMALDPANEKLFIANYGSANVTVVNTSTNTYVGAVPVGTHPDAIILNSVQDEIDVVNQNGATGNVTVIGGANDTVVGSVPVGSEPDGGTFVPSSDRVYVVNGASSNLTVFDGATSKVVGSVPTGTAPGPGSIAYDPTSDDLYVGGYESENVTIIDASTDTAVASVSTASSFPGPLLWTPAKAEVLAFDAGTSVTEPNVTVISTSTNTAVGSIPLATTPAGLAFDASTGDVYAANPAGNDTYWIGAADNTVEGNAYGAPEPNVLHTPVAYDSLNHDLYVVDTSASALDVLSSSHTLLTRVPVGELPVSVAFDATNGYLYVGSDLDGNVSVVDGTTNTVVGTLTIKMDDSIPAIGVDPTTNEVYVADSNGDNVTVYGASNFTRVAVLAIGSEPDAFAYDPVNRTMFVSTPGSGNISVLSAVNPAVVGAIDQDEAGPMLYDNASNSLYLGLQYGYGLAAINATSYANLGGSPLYLGPYTAIAGLALDPTNHHLFVSLPDEGSIEIIGTGPSFAVNFTETGLPSPTSWSVAFAGISQGTNGAQLDFTAPDGSWGFTVGLVPGYTPNVTAGTVVVSGAARTIPIHFTANGTTPQQYPVTFVEIGLPSQTAWMVTLGTTANSSATPTIGFVERDGSYAFAVTAVHGFTAGPGSGSLGVAGKPAQVNVTFNATSTSTGPPTVALIADPVTVSVGALSELATTVSGAAEPYTYAYSGLPTGCATANVSTLGCTPTVTGKFHVTVDVTNRSGAVGSATTNLTVTAASTKGTAPAPNGGSKGFLSSYWWLLLILAVIVVLLIALWMRRRQSPPPVAASPTTASGASGPPNPPSSP